MTPLTLSALEYKTLFFVFDLKIALRLKINNNSTRFCIVILDDFREIVDFDNLELLMAWWNKSKQL